MTQLRARLFRFAAYCPAKHTINTMRLPLNTLTGLALLCALGMSVPAALGTESFEQAKHGKFTTLSTKYGPMSCRDGVAEIGAGYRTEAGLEGYSFQGSTAVRLGGALDRTGPL